jgi:hypothetical protein
MPQRNGRKSIKQGGGGASRASGRTRPVTNLAPDGEARSAAANQGFSAQSTFGGLLGELEQVVRRHPLSSLLVILGLGFLLARTKGR